MRTLISLVVVGSMVLRPAAAQQRESDPMLSLDSLLNTRISTVAKYEQTPREAAASITIVTRDEIESYGYRTVADVLAAVPGFYLTDDRTFLTVGTRGFGRPADFNNRVLLLLDGHTTNDDFLGAAAVGEALSLNLDAVKQVEIVRGPSSALYGPGAVFAVINVVTRTGKDVDGASLTTSVGSLGHRGAGGTVGAAVGRLDVMLTGLWEDRDGQWLRYPEFPALGLGDGVADHQDWARRGGFAGTARLGDFRLLGRTSYQRSGISTLPFPGEDGYQRGTSSSAELGYRRSLTPKHEVMARTYMQWFRGLTHIPLASQGRIESTAESRSRGAEAAWLWDPASYSRLIVGAQYTDRYQARSIARATGFPDSTLSAPASVFSLYAQEQLTLGRHVILLGGLRGDFYSNGRSPIAPRAALVVTPRRSTTLKLLYGEALRVPTPLEDHSTEFLPDLPTLDPERVRTAELVWEERLTGWLQSALSGFVYSGSDFIDSRVDSTGFFSYSANVGEVTTRGAELALQARLDQRFHGYGSVELTRAQDDLTGERLTNSPAYLIKAGASRHLAGLDLAAELRHEAGRRTYRGGETAAFTTTNLTLSHRAHQGDGHFVGPVLSAVEFSLQVRNVFDARYRLPAPAGGLQDAFVQNGRTALATVGYRF